MIWYFVFAFYPALIGPALFGWLGEDAERVAVEIVPVIIGLVLLLILVVGVFVVTR